MVASESPHRPRHGRMHLLMLVVTFCWSSNIIAGKEALKSIGPVALAQLRVLLAASVYATWFLASGRSRRLRRSPRVWLFVVVAAFTGITLNQLAFIGGMSLISVAHTGLITALGPIMVLVIAVVIRLEALTIWKFAGMLVAFAGVGVLTADKAGRGSGHWTGDIIMLAGTAVFAVYTIMMKEVADQFDALTLNTLVYGMAAVMMLPVGIRPLTRVHWAQISRVSWAGLAFLVIFGSVMSYMLFAYVLTELSAARVAAFNYLQPVFASTLGIWVLCEPLTSKVLIGGVMILAGLYLTERERGEDTVRAESCP